MSLRETIAQSLRRLSNPRFHHSHNRRHFRRRTSFFKPLVEQLEDRRLLAVFMVNSIYDAPDVDPGDGSAADAMGNTTLRAAIMEANALGDPTNTINVPSGTYTLTITGSAENSAATGDLDLNVNLEIIGAGAGSTIIDAAEIDRVFHVLGGTVTIDGVTIQNGLAIDGDGGGILNEFRTLKISNSVIRDNRAEGAAGQEGKGGGLYDLGTTTITNSQFLDNRAVGGNDAGAKGGGIYSESTVSITGTTLSGNQAIGGPGGASAPGGFAQGGGIYGIGPTGSFFRTIVSGNQAIGGPGGDAAPGGLAQGGGIYSEGVTWDSFSDSTVADNLAIGGAGGTSSSGVAGEGGDASGGGIFSSLGSTWASVSGSTISGNEARGGTGGAGTANADGGAGGDATGGGISANFGDSWELLGNTTISTNSATGGDGGFSSNATAGSDGNARGGGFFLSEGGSVSAIHVTVTGNSAFGAMGVGGGLFVDEESGISFLSLHNTIVAANQAVTSSDVSGTFSSLGYNLIGDAYGGSGFVTTDILGGGENGPVIDPKLAPLGDNGGPTFTHALLSDSPAIDAADEDHFLPTDQRGVMRPIDGDGDNAAVPDIGAFEFSRPVIDIEKFTRVDVNPIRIEKLVRVEGPGIVGNVCDVVGKPVALTFEYAVGNTVSTKQAPDKAKIITNRGVDDDGISFVIVTDESDPAKALAGGGKRFFAGEVAFGALFEANEDVADFGSQTYLHFYDDNDGPLLQSVTYHTSCSQPIQLGDKIGNATLAGYAGEQGAVELPDFGPGIGDADADSRTGPEANVGDTVVFTYVVTNPIPGTSLSKVIVSDDILYPIMGAAAVRPVLDKMGFNVGDDGDQLLEFGEAWLYTSTVEITKTTPLGQHVDKATVVATTQSGATAMDVDPAHFVVVSPPMGEVCGVLGKPVALTFRYEVGNTVITNQATDKAKIITNNRVEDDGVSFVIVTDESDAAKALSGSGKRFFQGNVAVGGVFEANKSLANFGSQTYIHFYDGKSGPLLQSVTYHTSCSQPIQLGDVIGNATLVAYAGESGSAALPNPPAEPPDFDFTGIMLTTDVPFNPNNIGADADTPTGPLVQIGDKVTHTYAVSNPGRVPLTIASLFDDNETPNLPPGMGSDDFKPAPVLKANGKNFGDIDDNGFLDPNEVWYYQAMLIAAQPGQHTNLAKVTGQDAVGTMVTDADPSNYIVNPLLIEKFVVPPPVAGGDDVCATLDKPLELTFKYQRSNVFNPLQSASKAQVIINNGPDDDLAAYVVVSSSSSPGSGTIFFQGTVSEGETFTAIGGFGSNTFLYFFDTQAGGLLQEVQYHTSCSAPIILGAQPLSATLVGYVGQNGAQTIPAPGLGDAADGPTGPAFLLGDQVVFNFKITNSGNVGLTNVVVTDSALGTVTRFVDKGNGNNILDPGEMWVLRAGTTATVLGQQFNRGTVTATSVQDPLGQPLAASDPAYYFVEALKFFVVNNDADSTFTYTDRGNSIGSTSLNSGNSNPRGTTSNAAGTTLWVVDKDKFVYVYDTDGDFISSWKGKNLSDKVQGIATAGNDLWIVEEDRQVFFFKGGASFLSGERTETSTFKLSGSDIDKPTGITTDGTHLWIVDKGRDKVYKYTIAGTFVASWPLDGANSEPRGITINPADPSDTTVWVVDQSASTVFAYGNGKSNSGGSLIGTFALAAGNGKAEGIADPPPRSGAAPWSGAAPRSGAVSIQASDKPVTRAALELPVAAAAGDTPVVASADAAWRLDPALFEHWLPSRNPLHVRGGIDGRVVGPDSSVQPDASFALTTLPASHLKARDAVFSMLGYASSARDDSLDDDPWGNKYGSQDHISADLLSDFNLDAVFKEIGTALPPPSVRHGDR